MADNDKKAPAAAPAPTSFPLPVEEFCQQLSQKVKLPELIYAFSKDEIANGRTRDTAENYKARFTAFGGQIPA